MIHDPRPMAHDPVRQDYVSSRQGSGATDPCSQRLLSNHRPTRPPDHQTTPYDPTSLFSPSLRWKQSALWLFQGSHVNNPVPSLAKVVFLTLDWMTEGLQTLTGVTTVVDWTQRNFASKHTSLVLHGELGPASNMKNRIHHHGNYQGQCILRDQHLPRAVSS